MAKAHASPPGGKNPPGKPLDPGRQAELNQLLAQSPYRAEAHLGRGAMADVFVVRHHMLGKRFALKLIHSHLADEPGLLQRLRREARALGQAQNPHIVRIVDLAAATDGAPYVVLELMQGHSLGRELLETGVLPLTDAVQWAQEALLGLQAAHGADVIHRDITPDNLFLQEVPGYERVLKILDFGLSKLPRGAASDGSPASTSTATGTMVGSPAYASPEAFVGRRLDARADLYGVGLILFEMLTGKGPFDLEGHAVPPPSRYRREVPRPLDDVVLAATAANPDDRYPTATDFLQALDGLPPL